MPVAVGVYSIGFNIFNTLLMFPFVGALERVLSRIGREAADGAEDYSIPKFLGPREQLAEPSIGIPIVHKEMARYVNAAGLFLSIARGEKSAPRDSQAHHVAIDILGREIRRYTAGMFRDDTRPYEADLLASLIEEMDFTASLGETLFQVARRVERQPFSPVGREFVDATLAQLARAMHEIAPADGGFAVTKPRDRDTDFFCWLHGNVAWRRAGVCRGRSAAGF